MDMNTRAIHDEITIALDGINRINPGNIPTLQNFVDIQCTEDTYNLEANLALLRLYQFHPDEFSMEYCAKVLLKSLTRLPESDYISCKALIGKEHFQSRSWLEEISGLASLLERCMFDNFWATLKDLEHEVEIEPLPKIYNFETLIQNFICYTVSNTFQTINVNTLIQLLGGKDSISEIDLRSIVNQNGWIEDPEDSQVIFIADQESIIKPKNIKEKITFEGISSVIASSIAKPVF